MRNVFGILMFIAGVGMFWLAMARRNRIIADVALGKAGPAERSSLESMGAIMAPLVNIGLAIAGGQVVLAYMLTRGAGVFGLLDLVGFLVMLAGYGVWLSLKTRYRPGRLPG